MKPWRLAAACAARPCKTPPEGVFCRGHWFSIPWSLRNDTGDSWHPAARVSSGWLRDALASLGVPLRTLAASEPLSPEELRYRPTALRILAQHERPDYDACTGGQHPCPWASCPNNLLIDRTGGTIRFNHPGKDFDQLKDTCALDVIKRGELSGGPGVTDTEAGAAIGMKRTRVRQIVRKFREKLIPVLAPHLRSTGT